MRLYLLPLVVCLLMADIVSAAPFAYILNSGTKNVSVIDTATDTITATIPLPDALENVHPYPYGVAVGSSGQYVYAGMQDTNEVVIIDAARNIVSKRIGLGNHSPGGLAVNAQETRLYVTSSYSNLLLVYDISGTGAALVGAVAVSDQQISNPQAVVLDAARGKVYVGNASAGSVAVITTNETTNTYTRESLIDVGTHAMALALSTNGNKLFVAGLGDLVVINVSDVPTVEAGFGGGGLAMAVKGTQDINNNRIYAPHYFSDTLAIIDTTLYSVTTAGTYQLAAGPFGVSLTPDGAKLYITMNTGTSGDTVKVFDTASNTVIKTIPLPYDARPTSIGSFIGPNLPYTIFASQGSDCIITPQGAIQANAAGRIFDITTLAGNCEVTVDGVFVGLPSRYAFTAIAENHTIETSQAPSDVYHTLNATWSGASGAYLLSSPAGISSVSTSARFSSGTPVSLSASSGYTVTSWSGDCAGTVGTVCTLLMNGDKNAGAVLAAQPPSCPVTIGTACYSTIDYAINAANSGDIVKISATYTGPGISTTGGPFGTVTVSSGWDESFFSQTGSNAISQSTIQSRCAIVIDNLTF